MPDISIVEDDADTRSLIRKELESLNYTVNEVASGAEFVSNHLKNPGDLVVLDVGLPDLDGYEVCRAIRASGSAVPIIFVTSRAEEIDRVSGFALGADDYVTKPFSPRELSFRIKAILRRANTKPAADESNSAVAELRFGPLSINEQMRRVHLHGRPVALTALEFDLLLFFALNPGRPFTREDLMAEVWGIKSTQYGATVTTLLNRLRRKLEPDVENPVFILTVYGVGYRFVDPAVDEIRA